VDHACGGRSAGRRRRGRVGERQVLEGSDEASEVSQNRSLKKQRVQHIIDGVEDVLDFTILR
jgi:hypothetical protein